MFVIGVHKRHSVVKKRMASTNGISLLKRHEQNRRDSGHYSESCQSEVSGAQTNYSRTVEVESQTDKENTLETVERNSPIAISADDFITSKREGLLYKAPNHDAKSGEQERLLSKYVTDTSLNQSIGCHGLFENSGVETEKCGHVKNHTGVDVINRCDALINQLQDVTQKYFALQRSYQKVKKICYLMIVVNAVLLVLCITTVVPLLIILSRARNGGSQEGDGGYGHTFATGNGYRICFSCSDLKPGTLFSLETLVEVTKKDDTCCFESISSVVTSLLRVVGNTISDKTEQVKNKLYELNKRLLQIEVGLAPNTSNVIGNILQVMAPKERTAVYLQSVNDIPVSKSYGAFSKFMKLRWSSSEVSTILRGNVQLSEDGLNVNVISEAYYFFYTRITFIHNERDTYKRKTPLRYLVYRKRGSISSYIHEAKLNCVFNEQSQQHSVTTELILHLNRDDEIFVSIDEADKQLLATETGAHSIGLFEI